MSTKKYVLVCCKFYDVLLVEKEHFFEMCDVDKNQAKFKKKIFDYNCCGGCDTWLQGWAITHARGWGIVGSFDDVLILSGIYYLDID